MSTCKECIHYEVCDRFTAPNETYPEVGGCKVFKPKADYVEVVRCKDCIFFQPDFVLTKDGERRPYTEEEKELPYVSIDVGINCGSRCERHGYWEENKIPVWFSENDFCSYGERKGGEG